MKGFTILFFFILSFNAFATLNFKPSDLRAIKLYSGEILKTNSLQERTKVLKLLKDGCQSIELGTRIIYSEEVSHLVLASLTKMKVIERRPNPLDY